MTEILRRGARRAHPRQEGTKAKALARRLGKVPKTGLGKVPKTGPPRMGQGKERRLELRAAARPLEEAEQGAPAAPTRAEQDEGAALTDYPTAPAAVPKGRPPWRWRRAQAQMRIQFGLFHLA